MNFCFWTRKRAALVSLAVGFCLALGLTAAGAELGRFSGVCAQVRQDTLRLHIVAASNTVQDQTLKLRVRDAVLALAGSLCAAAPDQAGAQRILAQNLPALVQAAQQTLAARGSPQPVQVQLETAWFATARYGAFTLPAGRYRALRLTLGAGQGHNWWCCLYPALCLSASGAHYAAPAENALVTGDYELRFALVEWWEKRRPA